jgi:hypothetical protein
MAAPGKVDRAPGERKDPLADAVEEPCSRFWQEGRDAIEPRPAFNTASREGCDKAGRERALRAPLEPLRCSVCCLGQVAFQ